MLDCSYEFQNEICTFERCDVLDPIALTEKLASLSDKELEALTDELDFATFTGFMSDAISDIASRVPEAA